MFLKEAFKGAISLLSRQAKKKYLLAIFLQCSLGLLDIIGVALTAVIATLAANIVTGTEIPQFVASLVNFLFLENLAKPDIMLVIAIMTMFIFSLKTVLALFATRKAFRFLAAQQGKIATRALREILNSKYLWIKNQDPHILTNTLINGMAAATVNSLAQLMLITSELTLLALFFVILLIFNPVVSICTLIYLITSFMIINIIIGKKVAEFNKKRIALTLENQENIFNILKLFREIKVMGKEDYFSGNSGKLFDQQSRFFADDTWVQQIPKYAIELVVIFGAAGLLISQKFMGSGADLIPTIAIYLAGASRLFPSILRIQSSILSLRTFSALTSSAHDLLQFFKSNEALKINPAAASVQELENSSTVGLQVKELSFQYPDSLNMILDDINLRIVPGEHVAIVGPSGAGKSTLSDLLLGLLEPTNGTVTYNGVSLTNWNFREEKPIAYLPQEVVIISGTILDNVCLGIPDSEIDLGRLDHILRQVQLGELIDDSEDGVFTKIGISGGQLSGGQKQRIGVARALYKSPSLLILDESTSSLDAETENLIISSVRNIDSNAIVIAIAHRLSSIKDFPRIIYVGNGQILADGTFDQVRTRVSDFENQIQLMNIEDKR
jgi:ABC-type multidrug transport system fused ATPase/permease subunit